MPDAWRSSELRSAHGGPDEEQPGRVAEGLEGPGHGLRTVADVPDRRPRDDYEPYEAYMPTTTVGEFLAAYKRTIGYEPGDDPEAPAQPPGLPADSGSIFFNACRERGGLDEYPPTRPSHAREKTHAAGSSSDQPPRATQRKLGAFTSVHGWKVVNSSEDCAGVVPRDASGCRAEAHAPPHFIRDKGEVARERPQAHGREAEDVLQIEPKAIEFAAQGAQYRSIFV